VIVNFLTIEYVYYFIGRNLMVSIDDKLKQDELVSFIREHEKSQAR